MGAAEREHPGVLARAVVVERVGRPALLDPALELPLARGRVGEEPADGVELRRLRPVRGARDRELAQVEVVAGAHERQRLDRLRRGAQEGDEPRVARLLDDRAVAPSDRVDSVPGLDDRAATHHDLDRAH